jgi:hypothetical protein
VRQGENDGEHIWLRQSVTFTTNGQTRTVEIAIPLRPGATADEVEVLLSEADAGMERLARHLDARIASAIGTAGATPTAPAPAPATTPALAAGPAAPQGDSSPATSEQELRAPAPEVPLPSAPPAARLPTPAAPAAPPAATPAAAPPVRAPQAESPARPAPSRAAVPPPTAPRERSAAPVSAAPPAAEISRPEFLAAIRDLGMDARQAMQQLGVRSLEGLNLREALEALRRQNLRGDEPEPALEPAAAVPAPPVARASQPAVPPRYFEEEDEPEITFMVDGTPPREADDFALAGDESPSGEDDLSEDELDELDLDDVPDFAPPSSRAAPAPVARASARPAARRDTADSAAHVPAVPSGDETGAAILARLREATGGGAASGQQRTAYGNIIVRELGEAKAAALIRGVWRVPPERIGPEQMAELLSWGKRDTFGDEVALVLAELRAERDRAQANEEPGALRPNGAGPAPRPRGGAHPANRAGGS